MRYPLSRDLFDSFEMQSIYIYILINVVNSGPHFCCRFTCTICSYVLFLPPPSPPPIVSTSYFSNDVLTRKGSSFSIASNDVTKISQVFGVLYLPYFSMYSTLTERDIEKRYQSYLHLSWRFISFKRRPNKDENKIGIRTVCFVFFVLFVCLVFFVNFVIVYPLRDDFQDDTRYKWKEKAKHENRKGKRGMTLIGN